ncbi:MAG: DNA ligase D [Dehalococcoidia bacterium]|nr:MAG: DNA ligase D [Dehalococcoidia bacterium]
MDYEAKRRLSRTPEPPWQVARDRQGPLIFTVHKHAARRLHYDLRLELDGVLKSWAVPAGPSLNPEVKRLAVMVEDHPLGYASFEGTIPEGEYGAGQVIVWDKGDYSPDEDGKLYFDDRNRAQELLKQGLTDGKLSFFLRGHKMKGSWTLVRMKRGKNDWLLIKHNDEFADSRREVVSEGASVLSGATVEDLKTGNAPRLAGVSEALSGLSGVRKAPFPKKMPPMLAGATEAPFSGREWLFEPKLDGYRIIAAIDGDKVRLLSRNGIDVSGKYEVVAGDLAKQPASELVLDGEIIALDEKGRACFQCLQGFLDAMHRGVSTGEKAPAIIYYVFDILYFDGYSLLEVPLAERKKVLERALVPSHSVRRLEYFEGDGAAIYRGAIKQGLEGIIAKRKDSLYRVGRRSPDWLKVKSIRTDDFVIGGYTRGAGNRASTFGALLLGYYDEKNRLVSAGHVGTGFDDRLLAELKRRLDALKMAKSPFAESLESNAPATWVKPELVAEIKFSEWTQDGRLRVPVFLRLRDDKPAAEVRRAENTSVKDTGKADDDREDDVVTDVLKQLENAKDSFFLDVGKDRVELTNLDKELWPGMDEGRGLTKRDLLIYLARVSPYFLKHLQDCPLTLSRYPGGIGGEHFFQKHWASPLPEFVATVPLAEHAAKRQDYILCNNLPTLVWLGQVADIEFHTWFSRVSPGTDIKVPAGISKEADRVDFLSRYPDFIIFDLDPYIYSGKEQRGAEPELSREGFARTCEAALWLKETLDELGLSAFVKTSGMTGLHVYVPVLRQLEFHAVHQAAKTICQFLLKRHSRSLTTDWAVEKRQGKIFLDYNQNIRGKTLASVYSPRPSSEATVSTPLRWDELGKVYPADFTIKNLPDRLVKLGDLWGNVLDAKKDLKKILKIE